MKTMDHLFEHYKKTGYLHHAHVLAGMYDDIFPILTSAIACNLGVEVKGNPDVVVEYYEMLGVDEARGFKDAQTRVAFAGKRKIFIIGAKSFTHEAQNALLKTFEEPTPDTHFFIILPRAEMLLPTLRSRVLVTSLSTSSTDESKIFAGKFITASLEDRFAMIKKLTEKKSGEPIDRELVRRVLDTLERTLYTQRVGKTDETTSRIFRELFQAKTYLADRGSSPKMLLEHLAIIMDNKK